MPATVTASSPDAPPDAPQDQAVAGTPAGISRLLLVIHALIAYGKKFADALKQPGHSFDYPLWRRFGSNDPAVILTRLTRALLRAAALEQMLDRRAAKGLDVKEPPPAAPRTRKQDAEADTGRRRRRRPREQDSEPVRIPTPEELKAELRGRHVGAVLADICRDLGVLPGDLDPKIWRELQRAIVIYGGSAIRLFNDMTRRCLPLSYAMSHRILPIIPPGSVFAASGTGPP
jgi:hypothetical protein